MKNVLVIILSNPIDLKYFYAVSNQIKWLNSSLTPKNTKTRVLVWEIKIKNGYFRMIMDLAMLGLRGENLNLKF